ncbi:hypothetical protein DM02DRAFT_710704 [Periconia macrospinosa]|uniref:Uncharacterized protein n=1 Tax=Periconia macrospinosa TaxID=97972 RepID=A0A2V1CY86_9PLEO|nr:hypothetical protein DM02DRAFT_710704 [Periconia macrospinosa]
MRVHERISLGPSTGRRLTLMGFSCLCQGSQYIPYHHNRITESAIGMVAMRTEKEFMFALLIGLYMVRARTLRPINSSFYLFVCCIYASLLFARLNVLQNGGACLGNVGKLVDYSPKLGKCTWTASTKLPLGSGEPILDKASEIRRTGKETEDCGIHSWNRTTTGPYDLVEEG